MSAYLISEVRPLDANLFEEYREKATPAVEKYEGRFLTLSDQVLPVEGTWPEGFLMVVLEFPTMEALQGWYESPEYAEALVARKRGALERRMYFVPGVD